MSLFAQTTANDLTAARSSNAKAQTMPLELSPPCTDPFGENDTSKHSCDPDQSKHVIPNLQICNLERSAKRSQKKRILITKRMPDVESVDEYPKICVECGKMLNPESGYVISSSNRTGKLYLASACRPCQNHRVQVVAKLKQKHEHPPAGTPCQCCGRISKLFLDHTHGDDKFRGWICRECNSGIGLLGDSAESLKRAWEYLEASK